MIKLWKYGGLIILICIFTISGLLIKHPGNVTLRMFLEFLGRRLTSRTHNNTEVSWNIKSGGFRILMCILRGGCLIK